MATSPAPPRLLERLYLARQALDSGRQAAADPLPLGRMRAVMAVDDAAEWALVALLGAVGVRPKRDASLQEYLAALVVQKPALARHHAPLERLRRFRDRVKHDGIIPDPADARGAAADVESFFREALTEVLGKTLEQITPVEQVTDDVPKGHLAAAVEALERGEYEGAVTRAAMAFALGEARFFANLSPFSSARRQEDHFVRGLLRTIADAVARAAPGPGQGAQDVRAYAGRLAERLNREGFFSGRRLLEKLTEPTRLVRFGVDLGDLRRFEDVTPIVTVFEGGENFEVIRDRELGTTVDDAVFAIDFATRALLLLEDWERRNPKHLL